MAAYINRKQENAADSGAQIAIPLNRWSKDDYTLKVSATGTTAYTLQGTIDQVNRAGVTAEWFTLVDNQGTSLADLTAVGTYVVTETPLEAVRISHGAETASTFHVMQQGEG